MCADETKMAALGNHGPLGVLVAGKVVVHVMRGNRPKRSCIPTGHHMVCPVASMYTSQPYLLVVPAPSRYRPTAAVIWRPTSRLYNPPRAISSS